MRLSHHPKVKRDLNEAIDYYSKVRERLAEDFRNEVYEAFNDIRRSPTRHHFDASGLRRKNLKRFPYHIIYQILPDRIRVLAVRHDHQHPDIGIDRE